ncbi:SymE family type I addiction module toxin [Stenotrophomonas sp.]|uniref:SymE family type I addiction module toxin n=1 Tax=Stenotrophomonas sp. TaxID=69392 RepID=UPI0028A7B838|nr:SymE family type I addiction module toxin [Stenotrophomonas sp.]
MHSNRPDAPSSEPRKQALNRYPPNSLRVDTLYYPGYPAEPGDISVPCLKLRGLWMQAAGFEIGARIMLDVKPGAILLTVDTPPASAMPKIRKMGRLQLARLQQAQATT